MGMPKAPKKHDPANAYQGLLAEPMGSLGLLPSPEQQEKWALDRFTKTILLFRHFGIEFGREEAWRIP